LQNYEVLDKNEQIPFSGFKFDNINIINAYVIYASYAAIYLPSSRQFHSWLALFIVLLYLFYHPRGANLKIKRKKFSIFLFFLNTQPE